MPRTADPPTKPRDRFLAACQDVAREFEAVGFAFTKSALSLSRRRGEWRDHVIFQSSASNVENVLVVLRVRVNAKVSTKVSAAQISHQTVSR